MWLAETSLSDGVAIIIFATVLFLLLLGVVVFARWVLRIICGRSAPEAVVLVFPSSSREKDGDETEADRELLENFTWFLHQKLRENQLGHFAEFSYEGEEILVFFRGADANQIWQMIHAEAQDKTPGIPLRVILERSKKNGGQRIINSVGWQPAGTPLPKPELPTIPKKWMLLSYFGNLLTIVGIIGLFSWEILQKSLKLTENQFRDTAFGNYSAWIIGIFLIGGLSSWWFSHAKIRSFARQAGLPTDDSSTSSILKYVLLLVILIFGLLFVLVV